LLVGAALLVAAGLGYLIARETPVFAMRTVDVRGADRTLAAQVRSALDPISGTSLVKLDGNDVIQRVEDLPTVISAGYDRAFPHRLVVTVVPEQPVAVLRQGQDSWLVSARGRVMARLSRGEERKLPRIWVDRGVTIELGALLDGDTGRISPGLALLRRSRLAGRVATARPDEGALTLVLRSGVELLLGRPTDVALKLAVAASVLRAVGPQPGGYVDLTVPARPVARFNPQVEDRG
jgi:cell division protein FtsQ